MGKIMVFGSFAVDLVSRGPHLPGAGGDGDWQLFCDGAGGQGLQPGHCRGQSGWGRRHGG